MGTTADLNPEPYRCMGCGAENGYSIVPFSTCGDLWIYNREKCACELAEEERVKQEQERANLLEYLRSQCDIPKVYRDKTIDGLMVKPNTNIAKIQSLAREYLEKWPNVPRIIITGTVGCGKTHTACAIGMAVLESKRRMVRYANVPALRKEIRESWKDWGPADPIPYLIEATLLILDELDELMKLDWQQDAVYRIANERVGKPTIITTNLSVDEIFAAFGSRITDRLLEGAELWEIKAPSHRMEGLKRR